MVFEFTSPLTPYGSSTSGHAGSGDRYLFPEYSILEFLPGGTTVIASFLIIRKVDPNAPFPIEAGGDARGRGKTTSRSKKADKDKEKEKEKAKTTAQAASNNAGTTPAEKEQGKEKESEDKDSKDDKDPNNDKGTADAAPAGGEKQDNDKPKDKDKPKDPKPKLKEYYQPVTIRICSANPKVLEPLARVVKPPDEVRRYMEEVMDRAERAPEGFLALRLPREENPDGNEAENLKDSNSSNGNSKEKDNKNSAQAAANAARSRSRSSNKGRVTDDGGGDSGIENNNPGDEEDEEELKDFYEPPSGLVPFGV